MKGKAGRNVERTSELKLEGEKVEPRRSRCFVELLTKIYKDQVGACRMGYAAKHWKRESQPRQGATFSTKAHEYVLFKLRSTLTATPTGGVCWSGYKQPTADDAATHTYLALLYVFSTTALAAIICNPDQCFRVTVYGRLVNSLGAKVTPRLSDAVSHESHKSVRKK